MSIPYVLNEAFGSFYRNCLKLKDSFIFSANKTHNKFGLNFNVFMFVHIVDIG